MKTYYFKNELVGYVVHFELIEVGAAPDLSEPQAFQNVSLQLMIDQRLSFCRIFYKKLYHYQGFDFRYE